MTFGDSFLSLDWWSSVDFKCACICVYTICVYECVCVRVQEQHGVRSAEVSKQESSF